MKLVNYLKQNYLLCGIVLLAAFLRLFHLNFQSMVPDEMSTMVHSDPNISIKDLMDKVNANEGFPYLYFVLMRFFHMISYTPIVTRLFSAIMGILSVVYIYKLGKELLNRNTGLIAALLLTVNEFAIVTSQDSRPYALIVLATILSFYRLTILIKNPTIKNAIWYGVFCGLVINTSFFATITVFSQYLVLLFCLITAQKSEKLSLFKYYFISGIVTLLLFIPNYKKLKTLVAIDTTWIPKPTENSLSEFLKGILGTSEICNIIFMVLFIFYIVKVFNIKPIKERANIIKDNALLSFIICVSWIVVFIVIMYVKSIVGLSVMVHRYLISVLPAILIVFAMALSFVRNKVVQGITLFIIVVALLINMVLFRAYYTNYSKTQYRELAEVITTNVKPNETVYTSLAIWVNFFLSDENKAKVYQKSSLDDVIREMMGNSSTIKTFWYVNADQGEYTIAPENQEFINKTFRIDLEYTGYNVWAKHFVLR